MAPPWTSTAGRMETLQARCSAIRVARLFCRRLSERPSPPFISLGIASRERAASCADRLLDLAADVRRLSPPDHRDPEAFYIAKSGIADELRRVAHDAQRRLVD